MQHGDNETVFDGCQTSSDFKFSWRDHGGVDGFPCGDLSNYVRLRYQIMRLKLSSSSMHHDRHGANSTVSQAESELFLCIAQWSNLSTKSH